jgi:Putative beta-barrel porin-2, OmpL-like. bbp2
VKLIAQLLGATMLAHMAGAGEPDLSPAPEPRFKIYGWVEGGITFNFDHPDDRQNFGRLFDYRSDDPLLNQAVVTFERSLPSGPAALDWGFKLQLLVGSDARTTHSLGLFDSTLNQSIQFDIPEVYLSAHFPVLSAGGVDLKVGKFVTLEGAETIDPRLNFFYSHTYLFNFGIPLTHTGALAVWHANGHVDLYGGITRGVNTSIDDNNDALGWHGGVGFNWFDGKLTALATTHIGAETSGDNHDLRYLSDVTITAKLTKNFSIMTDMNYVYDKAADAAGYGIVQYFVYTINSLFSVGARAEVWRDRDGFYVTSFAGNDDAADALRGGQVTLDPRTVSGGKTTYGAITAGININPPVPKPLGSLQIRPEIRYDRSLNGTRPFNDSTDRDQLTVGLDMIVGF